MCHGGDFYHLFFRNVTALEADRMLDDDAVLLLPLITELQGSNLENKSIYKM